MRVAVVILAGGEGRRIGGNKPLRLLDGRTLLDHTLALAGNWSSDVAISVRDPSQAGDGANVALLIDEGEDGPIAGIASGLAFAAGRGLDAVLTIPCDTPLLPNDLLDRLISELKPGISAAVPASGGRLHPSCSLWGTEIQSLLPAYLATGRSSLKGLAAEAGCEEVEWPIEPYDPFFNVNTADDLAAAEAILKSR